MSVTTTSNRAAEAPNRFLAVRGGHDFMALGREVVGQGDAFDLFVVDDEDSHGGLVKSSLPRVRRFSYRPG